MQTRRETGYFWSNVIYTHNTRPFSKTHLLMLAMEEADKEKIRLLQAKHTHIHNIKPFSKTYFLMLAMEGIDKEGNRLLLVKHTNTTQNYSEKLTR